MSIDKLIEIDLLEMRAVHAEKIRDQSIKKTEELKAKMKGTK